VRLSLWNCSRRAPIPHKSAYEAAVNDTDRGKPKDSLFAGIPLRPFLYTRYAVFCPYKDIRKICSGNGNRNARFFLYFDHSCQRHRVQKLRINYCCVIICSKQMDATSNNSNNKKRVPTKIPVWELDKIYRKLEIVTPLTSVACLHCLVKNTVAVQ
jgi:hypothetical protein